MLGKPAKPMPQGRLDQIRELITSTPGIVEAHLPQCFIPGSMDSAAQVLFVVLAPGANGANVTEQLGRGIIEIVPSGEHLDVIPLTPENPLLDSVRNTGCSLGALASPKKIRPRWKFW